MEESLLSLPDGNYKNIRFDFRAYKNKKPKAPKQTISNYNDGLGDSANQNGVTLSNYNKNQATWAQNANKYAQGKLADYSGADTQARAFANNQYQTGLKRFKQTSDDTFGGYQADVAHRFGSLDNSTMDSMTKRFGQAQSEGLQDLGNQYDANYQNALNNYQAYWNGQLGIGQDTLGNIYNLGSGLSTNALNSSNASNQFSQNNYAQQVALYNAQKQADAAKFQSQQQIAATAAMMAMSDIRTKQNINKIDCVNGINIYEFEYKPEYNQPEGKHVGVIAQEVENIIPDSVIEINGIKHVDYSKVLPHIA